MNPAAEAAIGAGNHVLETHVAGVTSAAMMARLRTSPPESRAGMSAHPFGGGSRLTREVLIRVALRSISLAHPCPHATMRALIPGIARNRYGARGKQGQRCHRRVAAIARIYRNGGFGLLEVADMGQT